MSDERYRHLRFTLRTLAIAVTAICLWLGWNARHVAQLQSLLHDLQLKGGDWNFSYAGGSNYREPTANDISWLQWLFGDEQINLIGIPPGLPQADVRMFEVMFPETALVDNPISD